MPFSTKKPKRIDSHDIIKIVSDALRLFPNDRFKCGQAAALLAILYKTGCRISEALALVREDIRIADDFFFIKIKNLKRKKYMVTELPFKLHEDWEKNRLNFLILKHVSQFNGKEKLFDIGRTTFFRWLRKMDPETFPHNFRHNKATKLANSGAGDSQLRRWFGWEKGSNMPSHYIETSSIQMIPISQLEDD